MHGLFTGHGKYFIWFVVGVNGTKTKSNHILEVEKTLGIEAARLSCIVDVAICVFVVYLE